MGGCVAVCHAIVASQTTENVKCDKAQGSSSIIMMQGRLLAYDDTGALTRSVDVVVPTTVIEDTTAESLLGAIQLRLPWLFEHIAAPLVLVLNSDSAKANIRLSKHFCALARTRSIAHSCISCVYKYSFQFYFHKW